MKLPVQEQVSAGGVAYRITDSGPEVVLVRVGPARWQLPKGLVGENESPEQAALREVREEAGIDGQMLAPIETIEYWYVGSAGGQRYRFHKRVHFFLMAYRSGDPADHDWEVQEARWVPLPDASGLLTFNSERTVVEKAAARIADLSGR